MKILRNYAFSTAKFEKFEEVNLTDMKNIPEMFKGWSTDTILATLKAKTTTLRTSLTQVTSRKKRYQDKLNEKKAALRKAEKDVDSKKIKLQKLQAETAAVKADLQSADHDKELIQGSVFTEEQRIYDLDQQEKRLQALISKTEEDYRIVQTLEVYRKDSHKSTFLPLGDHEELREAVKEHIPHAESLADETMVSKSTMYKVLNFFHLNGVEGAKLGINNERAIFCKKLIKIMFPEDLPPEREASLSPDSKRKFLLAEMMEEADEAEAEQKARRQAKRRKSKVAKGDSTPDSEEPPKKRRKSGAWKQAAVRAPVNPDSIPAACGRPACSADRGNCRVGDGPPR